MKKILVFLKIIFIVLLALFLLYFVFGFYPLYSTEMLSGKYTDFKMELFVRALFASPLFVIFGVPCFVIKDIASLKNKVTLYVLLSASLALMFFVGALHTTAQNEYFRPKIQVKPIDFPCVEKIININKKIEKNPNNYKYYIEKGNLLSPQRVTLFEKSSETCFAKIEGYIYDKQNAIDSYKKALKLNPTAFEIYEKLYIAYLYGNTYKKEYDDEIIEYMQKAEKYAPNENVYRDLSEYYAYKGDYYKEIEYMLKADKLKNKEKDFNLPIPETSLIEKVLAYLPQSCKFEKDEIGKYNKAIQIVNNKLLANPYDKELLQIKGELKNGFENLKNNMPTFCKITLSERYKQN